ncbi:MAG TPA: hypothetical protein VKR30_06425 [Candidatus Limnocylindrales bacterium]|nr:hypothetical protein [Candidatus Limnocylindrales bacterium]
MNGGVVIVAYPDDEHGSALEQYLISRDERVLRTSLPAVASTGITWDHSGAVTLGGLPLGPGGWSGFWRRPGRADLRHIEPRFGSFAETELRDSFNGSLLSAGVRWINDPITLGRAENKLVQLSVARSLGIDVPETLVTSSETRAERFLADGDEAVVKAVRYGLVSSGSTPEFAWTHVMYPDAERRYHGIPVLIQRRIRALHHVRIVTVGRRTFVYCLENASPEHVDWRQVEANHSRWRPANRAPKNVRIGAVRLARALRLSFTSQDWIVDESSHPVFLEANPNGQWMFLEGKDEPITAAIGEWLIRSRKAPHP